MCVKEIVIWEKMVLSENTVRPVKLIKRSREESPQGLIIAGINWIRSRKRNLSLITRFSIFISSENRADIFI